MDWSDGGVEAVLYSFRIEDIETDRRPTFVIPMEWLQIDL